ncbi:MAG: DUF1844 domain-containing protein [Acidobacteriota bacterium]
MSEEIKGGKVKVIDRRWFNADGEPRDDPPAAVEAPRPAAVAEPPTAPAPPEEPAPAPSPPELEKPVRLPQRALLDLVDFLSQYAMAFLSGQVQGLDRDPAAARLFIDLLAEVQRRTRDQLSLQETKVLDDVLFQLRAYYITPR